MGTHGSSFSSGRSSAAIWLTSERSSSPVTGRPGRRRRRGRPSGARPSLATPRTKPRAGPTSPKRRRRSSSSTASSRSSASSDTSKSASRVTRKTARSAISICGKSQGRKWAITRSSGTNIPRFADLDEARQPLRDLHAREPLLARFGVDARTRARLSESAEMYGNGWPGRRRAASASGRSRGRRSRASSSSSLLGAVVDAADQDSLLGRSAGRARAPRAAPGGRSGRPHARGSRPVSR